MDNHHQPPEREDASARDAQNVLKLTERDSVLFVEALLNPPDPNDRLRAALQDYRTFFGE